MAQMSWTTRAKWQKVHRIDGIDEAARYVSPTVAININFNATGIHKNGKGKQQWVKYSEMRIVCIIWWMGQTRLCYSIQFWWTKRAASYRHTKLFIEFFSHNNDIGIATGPSFWTIIAILPNCAQHTSDLLQHNTKENTICLCCCWSVVIKVDLFIHWKFIHHNKYCAQLGEK